jgi:hypothetical protein
MAHGPDQRRLWEGGAQDGQDVAAEEAARARDEDAARPRHPA